MRLTRRDYNPVSSSPSDDADDNNNNNTDDDQVGQQQQVNDSSANSTRRRQRQNNNNVSLEVISKEDTPLRSSKTLDSDDDGHNNSDSSDDENDNNSGGERIRIVILDSAQKRFPIDNVNPDWSVSKFKRIGAKTHKVQPQQQRLIFRGKMLKDDDNDAGNTNSDDNNAKNKTKKKTLREYGIHTENDLIVHLFPKPRVVVTSSSADDSSANVGTAGGNNDSGGGGGGGAHIPSIVIDHEEQQRRGQILVLGSVEIAESQNNVKMLSLMLFVICSMRLLALFSIAMGVDEEPSSQHNDDLYPPSGHNTTSNNSTHHHHHGYDPNDQSQEVEQRSWQNGDYFDLVVSIIGFYVATLGMKATQENTLRLANAYFIGTIVAGIAWNAFNIFEYIKFYNEESAEAIDDDRDDDIPPLTRDDYVTIAFFTVAMPVLIWGLCWARAFEFRRLIEEAETEAADRIRSQLSVHDDNNDPEQQQQQQQSGGRNRTTSSNPNGRRQRHRNRSRPDTVAAADQELEDLSSSSASHRTTPEIV